MVNGWNGEGGDANTASPMDSVGEGGEGIDGVSVCAIVGESTVPDRPRVMGEGGIGGVKTRSL